MSHLRAQPRSGAVPVEEAESCAQPPDLRFVRLIGERIVAMSSTCEGDSNLAFEVGVRYGSPVRVACRSGKTLQTGHFPHLVRDVRVTSRDRRSSPPMLAAKDAYLQEFCSGSDGTRTRDLRRDRCARAVAARFVYPLTWLYDAVFSRFAKACLSPLHRVVSMTFPAPTGGQGAPAVDEGGDRPRPYH